MPYAEISMTKNFMTDEEKDSLSQTLELTRQLVSSHA
ncbi:hypothetical protein J2Z37_003355 [Ammoniphilus resinae]|uniref:4-oxalocrotonate tautomerase n=1 Tax=Ammoniphilus resinae TaxID=861532 RepID=A0ABS4GT85_9BACL|nr:hypothetical protein [Ammoniphilus resinae]